MSNQVPERVLRIADRDGDLREWAPIGSHLYSYEQATEYVSLSYHEAELERVRRETQLETFRIFTDAAAEFLGRTKVDKIIGGALEAARDAALSVGKGATSEKENHET